MINWELLRERLLPSQAQRNYRLGVINGVLFSLAEALIDATLVLALFVRELGGSQALVGLLPSLRNGGFLLPQLLVAGRVAGMPRKLPLYRRAALARTIVFAAMSAVIFSALLLPPTLVLVLFCLLYTLYNLAGGSSSLAFQDVVAKAIPPRRRGSFFSNRQLWGGLLAFLVAGPLVRALLQGDGPLPFPANYGVLSLLSLIGVALGLLAFSMIDEPPMTQPVRRQSLRETLEAAPRLFRENIDFRRFITVRVWARVGAIADPFYIVYAREALGIAPRYVGIYLALRVFSAALSNLYWGRVVDRQGNRRLMVLTGSIAAGAPVAALLLPLVFAPGSTALAWAFTLVFLLIGLSVDGSMTAGSTYLLEIAPEHERVTYAGIANTALGIVTFVPVLGGLLLTATGNNYPLLLVLAMAGSAVAWATTIRLREVREVREDMRLAAELRDQRRS
jgi:MFS family permease